MAEIYEGGVSHTDKSCCSASPKPQVLKPAPLRRYPAVPTQRRLRPAPTKRCATDLLPSALCSTAGGDKMQGVCAPACIDSRMPAHSVNVLSGTTPGVRRRRTDGRQIVRENWQTDGAEIGVKGRRRKRDGASPEGFQNRQAALAGMRKCRARQGCQRKQNQTGRWRATKQRCLLAASAVMETR